MRRAGMPRLPGMRLSVRIESRPKAVALGEKRRNLALEAMNVVPPLQGQFRRAINPYRATERSVEHGRDRTRTVDPRNYFGNGQPEFLWEVADRQSRLLRGEDGAQRRQMDQRPASRLNTEVGGLEGRS